MVAAPTASSSANSSDITQLLLPNLDRHLCVPLLDNLVNKNLASQDEVSRAKYELIKSTNMIDYLVELKREIEEEGGSVQETDQGER
jgi:translation initiation factor 3 subunit E